MGVTTVLFRLATRDLPRARAVCFAAVVGSTMPDPAGCLTATPVRPATITASTAFALLYLANRNGY